MSNIQIEKRSPIIFSSKCFGSEEKEALKVEVIKEKKRLGEKGKRELGRIYTFLKNARGYEIENGLNGKNAVLSRLDSVKMTYGELIKRLMHIRELTLNNYNGILDRGCRVPAVLFCYMKNLETLVLDKFEIVPEMAELKNLKRMVLKNINIIGLHMVVKGMEGFESLELKDVKTSPAEIEKLQNLGVTNFTYNGLEFVEGGTIGAPRKRVVSKRGKVKEKTNKVELKQPRKSKKKGKAWMEQFRVKNHRRPYVKKEGNVTTITGFKPGTVITPENSKQIFGGRRNVQMAAKIYDYSKNQE